MSRPHPRSASRVRPGPARWDLIDRDRYAWASVQTVRGCPKHCSFCSVWRTDGQAPRQRAADGVIEEIVELMARLAQLPADLVFFTQITMEAAEDPAFLDAMRTARIRGALVGIEAVTPEGLRTIHKDFNVAGEALVSRLRQFREHGVHVLGSFIFGLSSDRPDAGSRGPRPATRGPPGRRYCATAHSP